MEWYWWLIIAVAIVGMGALKLLVFNRIKNKRDKKPPHHKDED